MKLPSRKNWGRRARRWPRARCLGGSGFLQAVRAYGRYLAALDPRSLACFRILTGLVLLHDIGMAWESLDEWAGLQGYYDELPLPVLPFAEDAVPTLALLFLAYGICGLALLLGLFTRLSTLAVWLLACGHQFAVRHTGDYHDLVLSTLLFWCLFLDLGQTCSVDAWRRRRRGRPAAAPGQACQPAAALLTLNVAYIYLCAVVLKTGSGWWQDGTAVLFALKDFAMASDAGAWLAGQLPFVFFRAAAHLVVAVELVGPLLLLSLWRPATSRLLGCGLLLGFAVALWLLMDLEAFPLTMAAAVCALLPGRLWERLPTLRLADRVEEGAPTPVSRPALRRRSWLRLAMAAYLLINLEGHRIQHLEEEWPYPGARALVSLQQALGMELIWKMYAPEPREHAGWWVGVGITADGREVDPITGRLPTLAPPSLKEPPFAGLGGLYWFEAPVEGGWPQHVYARYILWRDERQNPPERQLTHFLLLYMHEPFWPLQPAPHPARPLLVMRWPDDQQDPPPALAAGSLLCGLEMFAVEFGSLEKKGWQPQRLPPLSTY